MLEHIQKTREHGYNVFVRDVLISVQAYQLRLKSLNNLITPNLKECKRIKKSLEEAIKHEIKALQFEAKYFNDIRDGTLAGRFGAGAITFSAEMANEMFKKSLAEFQKMPKE